MTRYVLMHPERGIYLGGALGLGFWSKWDAVGQTAACTFGGFDEAMAYAKTWQCGCADVTPYAITAAENAFGVNGLAVYASIDTCVAAGLEGWMP